MKTLFVLLLIVAAFIGCKNEADKSKAEASNMATSVVYPYTASYSSNFEIGQPNYSKIILDLWKDYDDNTFQKGLPSFADSVSMFFANGAPYIGTSKGAMEMATSYRSQFSSVRSVVNAFVPLKSVDKKENWVCVWGTEYDTKDGKTDSVFLQETWRFNKDGKVDLMYQYSSKPPAAAAK
jgi:hypothetical protein